MYVSRTFTKAKKHVICSEYPMSSKLHLSKWKTYFFQFIDKYLKIEELEYLIHYVKFRMCWKTRKCYTEDAFKTSSRRLIDHSILFTDLYLMQGKIEVWFVSQIRSREYFSVEFTAFLSANKLKKNLPTAKMN